LNNVYTTVTGILSGTTGQNGSTYVFSPTAPTTTATTYTTFPSLLVTVVGTATLAVGNYLTVAGANLVANTQQIIALGTGAGGTGSYVLNSGTAVASTTFYYYTLTYVNSTSKYSATNLYAGQSLSSYKYAINWKEIFGNLKGECRCRVRYLSNSGNSISWISNTGSIRASFQSTSSNNTNLCNLGCIRPQNDYTGTNFTYLDCDTTTSNGVTLIIPTSNQDFYVNLVNSNEAQMINVPDFQIWFYFDCDEDTTTDTVYNNNLH